MQGRAHLLFGLAVGVATSVFCKDFCDIQNLPSLVTGAAAGSLILDIDNPTSTVGSKFPLISNFIKKTIGHRNFLHSLLNVLLFYILGTLSIKFINNSILLYIIYILLGFYFFKSSPKNILAKIAFVYIGVTITMYFVTDLHFLLLGLSLGMLSHLLCDAFTTEGVAFFLPFSNKRYSFRHVNSGKQTEFFYVILFSACYCLLLFISNNLLNFLS